MKARMDLPQRIRWTKRAIVSPFLLLRNSYSLPFIYDYITTVVFDATLTTILDQLLLMTKDRYVLYCTLLNEDIEEYFTRENSYWLEQGERSNAICKETIVFTSIQLTSHKQCTTSRLIPIYLSLPFLHNCVYNHLRWTSQLCMILCWLIRTDTNGYHG